MDLIKCVRFDVYGKVYVVPIPLLVATDNNYNYQNIFNTKRNPSAKRWSSLIRLCLPNREQTNLDQ